MYVSICQVWRHTCDPSAKEAEAGILNSKPTYLHSEAGSK